MKNDYFSNSIVHVGPKDAHHFGNLLSKKNAFQSFVTSVILSRCNKRLDFLLTSNYVQAQQPFHCVIFS